MKPTQETVKHLEDLLKKERQKNAQLKAENIKLKASLRFAGLVGQGINSVLGGVQKIIEENEQLKADIAEAQQTLNAIEPLEIMKKAYYKRKHPDTPVIGVSVSVLDAASRETLQPVDAYGYAVEFVGGDAAEARDIVVSNVLLALTATPSIKDFKGTFADELSKIGVLDGDLLNMFRELVYSMNFQSKEETASRRRWYYDTLWARYEARYTETSALYTRESFVDALRKFIDRTLEGFEKVQRGRSEFLLENIRTNFVLDSATQE